MKYIVSILGKAPLVFFARWEGEAFGPEAAQVIAKREKQAPTHCECTVRPAPPATHYRREFHDSITDRFDRIHA